MIASHRVK